MTPQLLEESAQAMTDVAAFLADALPVGRSRARTGVNLAVTTLASPMLNAVRIICSGTPAAVIEELISDVAATGLSYSVQTREGPGAAFAEDRGMTRILDVPLMRLTALAPASPSELSVRRLADGEMPLHNEILGEGFEVPREFFAPYNASPMLSDPAVSGYVGLIGDVPVTTGDPRGCLCRRGQHRHPAGVPPMRSRGRDHQPDRGGRIRPRRERCDPAVQRAGPDDLRAPGLPDHRGLVGLGRPPREDT